MGCSRGSSRCFRRGTLHSPAGGALYCQLTVVSLRSRAPWNTLRWMKTLNAVPSTGVSPVVSVAVRSYLRYGLSYS